MNVRQFHLAIKDPFEFTQLSKGELNEITSRYPWFAAAHFLSGIKANKEADVDAAQLVQKALLYTDNPAWFNWQLQHLHEPQQTTTVSPAALNEEEVSEDETDAALDADTIVAAADELEQTVQEQEAEKELDAEALLEAIDETELLEQQVEAEKTLDAETILTAADDLEIAEQQSETDLQLNAESLVEAVTEIEVEAVQQEHEVEADAAITVESSEKVEQLMASIKEAADQPGSLSFEPFHTVDYFASQGIKLQEEKLGNDQLSKQVKTFTQWLKSMKKIYNEEKQQLDQQSEQSVIQIADVSNKESEIITETMAQVLIQQGKKGKAIEVYRKLSLLHPEKSAYFADQIAQLKS